MNNMKLLYFLSEANEYQTQISKSIFNIISWEECIRILEAIYIIRWMKRLKAERMKIVLCMNQKFTDINSIIF